MTIKHHNEKLLRNLTNRGFGLGFRKKRILGTEEWLPVNEIDEASAPPEVVDWRPRGPAPWDQGRYGSCVAHAVSYLVAFGEGSNMPDPARAFNYDETRLAEGTPLTQDSGCEIADAVKVAATLGYPHESLWPYDNYHLTTAPPQSVRDEAAKITKNLKHAMIPHHQSTVINYIAHTGPLSIGAMLYASFEYDETLRTGIVPMPDTKNEQLLGGHAMAIVGYDMKKRWFILRNSWGTQVGDNGYFYLPFDYFNNPNLVVEIGAVQVAYTKTPNDSIAAPPQHTPQDQGEVAGTSISNIHEIWQSAAPA